MLGEQIIGYEFDEDLDNGSRPAGLIRLSETFYPGAPRILDETGSSYAQVPPGVDVNHHLTLYRAPSGALVFGAGTVQWSWGLDGTHDGPAPPESRDMQQATVNLFADMGVQPQTLQGDLVPAAASTDTTAPTATITSPTPGATIQVGTPIAIQGTATDAGGGVVGAVEISVNGGSTWRPAVGRGTWSYAWTPGTAGSVTIRARAADDSGNLQTPGAAVNITVSSTDVTAPTVTARSPTAGATGITRDAAATVTFSEAMDAATINTSTVELRDPANALVLATVSYNATTRTATLTPNSAALATLSRPDDLHGEGHRRGRRGKGPGRQSSRCNGNLDVHNHERRCGYRHADLRRQPGRLCAGTQRRPATSAGPGAQRGRAPAAFGLATMPAIARK